MPKKKSQPKKPEKPTAEMTEEERMYAWRKARLERGSLEKPKVKKESGK